MLRRAPISTLFPYTTLFRSDDDPEVLSTLGRFLKREGFDAKLASSGPEALDHLEKDSFELIMLDVIMPGIDRKSTRLNSSHVKISYAVFCLKKKNETKYSTATLVTEAADETAQRNLRTPKRVLAL